MKKQTFRHLFPFHETTKKNTDGIYSHKVEPRESYKEIATNSCDHKSTLKYASTQFIWIANEKY